MNILIYGIGGTAELLWSMLDHHKVNTIGFVDSGKGDLISFYKNKRVLLPKEIKNINYDKLIVASSYYEEILKELHENEISTYKTIIFKNEFYHSFFQEHLFCKKTDQFSMKQSEIQVIATGLSYARDAIDPNYLELETFNFAHSSQDLFGDYSIIKHVFENYSLENLKKIIIGMGYFSFQYDMSKSINAYLTPRYYSITNTYRSYDQEGYYHDFRKFILTCYSQEAFAKYQINEDNKFKKNKSLVMSYEDKVEGKKTAQRHSKKAYPITQKENIFYFKEIIKLCNKRGVTPICIVFPTSKYYYEHLSEEMKLNFLNIIEEFTKTGSIKFYDFTGDYTFTDSDFWDSSHLNNSGALKVSDKLKSLEIDVKIRGGK
ncbi:hypothetical protein MJ257_10310 [Paenibacillus timonensis]|uniref:Chemotaxis protein n=1 Tax=Paenibacillus timonensis TaxID=225915 RepID=A0ABW3S9P3_9BACL|nr:MULTISPECIES: hypothetical protein [Paenibacillus]MCH1640500.1 hypothetical protein [Paenibacillus timonensis]MDU2241231.1 hypothetical protein [Paenibacillus sp.]